jgi:hypothetical protein
MATLLGLLTACTSTMPRSLPPILADALAHPYVAPFPPDCEIFVSQLEQLDRVLGRDWDAPASPPRRGEAVQRWAVGEVRGAIPCFTWFWRLTGAERRQRIAEAAHTAGHARRGYLRGLSQVFGCWRHEATHSDDAR